MAIPADELLQEDFDFPINEANLDQVRALQSRLPFLGQQRSIYGGGAIGSGGLNFTGYTPQYSSMVGPIATGQAYAQSISGGMPMSQVIAPGISYSPDVPGGYTQADLNVVNLPRDVAPVFPEAPTTGEVFQPSYPTMPYAPTGTPMPTQYVPPMGAQPSTFAPTIFGQTVPTGVGDLFENQGFLNYLDSLDLDVSGIKNYLADQEYLPTMTPETNIMPTVTPTTTPDTTANAFYWRNPDGSTGATNRYGNVPDSIKSSGKFYNSLEDLAASEGKRLVSKDDYLLETAQKYVQPVSDIGLVEDLGLAQNDSVDILKYLREQQAKEEEQRIAENLANLESTIGPLPTTETGDVDVLEMMKLYNQQKAAEEAAETAARLAAEEQAKADAYTKMATIKPTLMPTMQPQSRSVMPKIPSFFNLA